MMDFTIEELKAQYKALGEQIAQKEKDEKEAKQKKLEAEKESRYQSIVLEMEKLATMIESWNADYGAFAVKGNVSPYLFHYFL